MMENVQSTRRNIIAFLAKDEKWHFIKKGDKVRLVIILKDNPSKETAYINGYSIKINSKQIEIDKDVYFDLYNMGIPANDAN